MKWCSNPGGYGFITGESGRDIFVHYTAIEGTACRSMDAGENVAFAVGDSDRGLRARDVTRMQEAAAG